MLRNECCAEKLLAGTNVVLPSTVTDISWWVFKGCTSLVHFDVPKKIVNLHQNALVDSAITSICIPQTIESIEGRLVDFIHL